MAIKSEQLNVDEKKLKRVNKYTAELLENLNQIAAIDFFNVSFKNLEEAVANIPLETVEQTLDAHDTIWGDAIEKFEEKAQTLIEQYERIAESFNGEVLREAVNGIGEVFKEIDWGTLATAGLVMGAITLAGTFGTMFVAELSKIITGKLGEGVTLVLAGIKKLLTETKIGQIIELTLGGAGTLGESVGAVFGTTLPVILAVITGIVAVIAGIVDLWNTSETFRENVKNMLDIIGAAFGFAKEQIWDNGLLPLWESIKEMFKSFYELYETSGLKQIFEAVVTAVGYIASVVFSGLVVAISELVREIFNKVQIVIEVIDLVLDVVKEFLGAFEDVVNGIIDICEGINEFLAGVFSGDWSRAWEGVKKVFGGVWSAFVGLVKSPLNTVIGILNSFLMGVEKMANAIGEALSFHIELPDIVSDFFGVKSIGWTAPKAKVPRIPYLASGGMINTGQMFIARENGITEMVGRIGNRAAVANNDQIVRGIALGVHSAVTDAAAEIMFAMNSGNAGSEPIFHIIVKTEDDEVLARAVQRGKSKLERRLHPMGAW